MKTFIERMTNVFSSEMLVSLLTEKRHTQKKNTTYINTQRVIVYSMDHQGNNVLS